MDKKTIQKYYTKRIITNDDGEFVVGTLDENNPEIYKAIKIAHFAHVGQMDKGGHPFIYHPITLAEEQNSEDAIVTALLHDVIEDTPITLEDLRKEGIKENVLEALDLLCHRKKDTYFDYFKKLEKNPLAYAVKQSDMKMNLDLNRLEFVRSKDAERQIRYESAFKEYSEEEYASAINLAKDRTLRTKLAKNLRQIRLEDLKEEKDWAELLGSLFSFFDEEMEGTKVLPAHHLVEYYVGKEARPLEEAASFDATVAITVLRYLSSDQKEFEVAFKDGFVYALIKSLKVSLFA